MAKETNGPGQSLMRPPAIIALLAYLVFFLIFIIYTLICIWPPLRPKEVRDALVGDANAKAGPSPGLTASPSPSPAASPTVSPGASPAPTAQASAQPTATVSPSAAATTPNAAANASGAEVECEQRMNFKEGFCLNEKGEPRVGVGALRIFWNCYCIYDEDRLLIIVMLGGALGALVHAFRSLSWYIGNREAVMSWAAMYVMLPFLGAGLAVVFYFVIRGGFFSPTSSVDATSPFGFAALAALIGMFTEPAVIKLRKVATTIFEPPERGKDHVGPAPKVTVIMPQSGTTAGGETVSITGSDFSVGVKVLFDQTEAPVTASTTTSITATTPPHAAGKVDITIINEDKQQQVLKEGFEYIDPGPPVVGPSGDATEGDTTGATTAEEDTGATTTEEDSGATVATTDDENAGNVAATEEEQ